MKKYTIKANGEKVGTITANDAQEAARAFSEKKGPDSEWGFVRGVKMLDSDTRGKKWAILKTDGGDLEAEMVATDRRKRAADLRAAAAAMGAAGGSVTGGTKADAARENGKLGGRPRKEQDAE